MLALVCIVISLVGFNLTREFDCNVCLPIVCRNVKRTLTNQPFAGLDTLRARTLD